MGRGYDAPRSRSRPLSGEGAGDMDRDYNASRFRPHRREGGMSRGCNPPQLGLIGGGGDEIWIGATSIPAPSGERAAGYSSRLQRASILTLLGPGCGSGLRRASIPILSGKGAGYGSGLQRASISAPSGGGGRVWVGAATRLDLDLVGGRGCGMGRGCWPLRGRRAGRGRGSELQRASMGWIGSATRLDLGTVVEGERGMGVGVWGCGRGHVGVGGGVWVGAATRLNPDPVGGRGAGFGLRLRRDSIPTPSEEGEGTGYGSGLRRASIPAPSGEGGWGKVGLQRVSIPTPSEGKRGMGRG